MVKLISVFQIISTILIEICTESHNSKLSPMEEVIHCEDTNPCYGWWWWWGRGGALSVLSYNGIFMFLKLVMPNSI